MLHLSCLLHKNCFLIFKTFSLFASVPLLNNVLYQECTVPCINFPMMPLCILYVLYQWCTVPLIFRRCPYASYMYCLMYPVPWLWYCFVHPVRTIPVKMYCVLRNIMYVYSKRHVHCTVPNMCYLVPKIPFYYTICVVPHCTGVLVLLWILICVLYPLTYHVPKYSVNTVPCML